MTPNSNPLGGQTLKIGDQIKVRALISFFFKTKLLFWLHFSLTPSHNLILGQIVPLHMLHGPCCLENISPFNLLYVDDKTVCKSFLASIQDNQSPKLKRFRSNAALIPEVPFS